MRISAYIFVSIAGLLYFEGGISWKRLAALTQPPRKVWTDSEGATRVSSLSAGCDQVQRHPRAGPLPPRAGRT